MTKQEMYELLNKEGIKYEAIEHEVVFTIEDMLAIPLPHPEQIAKNLFVRDAKKRNYYLITAREDKRVDLKELASKYGLGRLSFANEDDLFEKLGLHPGSVTPLGLLNNPDCRVQFLLDRGFKGKKIAVHPNESTATIYLETQKLWDLLWKNDIDMQYIDL